MKKTKKLYNKLEISILTITLTIIISLINQLQIVYINGKVERCLILLQIIINSPIYTIKIII